MKIAIIFGTRPEIIKLSEIVKMLARSTSHQLHIIHTGQHYSYNLSERFLEDLDLPRIEKDIAVGSMERLDQIRKMVVGLEVGLVERPDVVIVQGDTNSTLAGAIAARNLGIPVAHVEAGLRCFDPLMVEEINRTAVDRISDVCLAPTSTSVRNLEDEGIDGRDVFLVGNTIVEVVCQSIDISRERSRILQEMELEPDRYILITAHRQENVDEQRRLENLVTAFERIDLPMVYPVHPRTLEKIVEFELLHRLEAIDNLELTDPMPYYDFLQLARKSRLIITDSGGIQEECTIYKKPIIVVRDNTERPEILGTFGSLTGSDPDSISAEVERLDRDYSHIISGLCRLPSPFGDGSASQRIIETLESIYD